MTILVHSVPPIAWVIKALYLLGRGEYEKHSKAMASFAVESLVYTICVVAVLFKFVHRDDMGYQVPYIEVRLEPRLLAANES